MVVLATLVGEDAVGGGFGRAETVALARRDKDGTWSVARHDVHWGSLHGTRAEGLHHAAIARFLKEQGVDTVATGHMGDGMVRMLQGMGIRTVAAEGPLSDVLRELAARS